MQMGKNQKVKCRRGRKNLTFHSYRNCQNDFKRDELRRSRSKFQKCKITVGYRTSHFTATTLTRLAVCARASGQGV